MGDRPKKTIGWVVETTRDNVHLDTIERLYDERNGVGEQQHSYQGFYDYIAQYPVGESIIGLDEYSDSLEQYNILKFANIIVDDDEFNDSEAVYCVLYPMLMSPYGTTDVNDPGVTSIFSEGDTPFVHAEFEHLAPEHYMERTSFSYDVNIPIYPTEYSIIEKRNNRSMASFHAPLNIKRDRDIYIVLRRVQDYGLENTQDEEILAVAAGFDSVADLAEHYELAPPEELFAFANYLNIFKDPSLAYTMRPKVVYYWT